MAPQGNQNARKHGHSARPRSKTYKTWEALVYRATRSPDSNYDHVIVCERWRKFENFLADMGERPPGTSIDRVDGLKGYEPGNCRWATRTEQNRNRKSVKLRQHQIEEIRRRLAAGARQVDLAREFGVGKWTIQSIHSGRTWREDKQAQETEE